MPGLAPREACGRGRALRGEGLGGFSGVDEAMDGALLPASEPALAFACLGWRGGAGDALLLRLASARLRWNSSSCMERVRRA